MRSMPESLPWRPRNGARWTPGLAQAAPGLSLRAWWQRNPQSTRAFADHLQESRALVAEGPRMRRGVVLRLL
jgi:hypothetical protein